MRIKLSELKQTLWGETVQHASEKGPVTITRNGKDKLVLISKDTLDKLTDAHKQTDIEG